MSIEIVKIKNLTVFDDLKVNLSSGVNVFIGQNGTGKTHLLKAVYGACEASKEEKDISFDFLRCFKEDTSYLNFLHNTSSQQKSANLYLNCDDKIAHDERRCLVPLYNENNQSIWGEYCIHTPNDFVVDAVYIPVKDMLTHAKGLLAMGKKYRNFPFDKTLTDIIRKSSQWTVKNPPLLANSILPVLEKIMDGEVYMENEEFFIKKNNGDLINFAIEAEGIKKIGLLWQLIMTENITEKSILLWDEPEANLNPEYLPLIVDCLLELSRHNVQILVSTHNYIFAKYFDVKRREKDAVKFHALYKEGNAALCETKDFFGDLEHNAITKTFNKLLDEVYDFEGE